MKSGSKILPFGYPPITTYTHHAHLLSILTNYKSAYPWIYSNYIQLYINKDYTYSWGDFYFPFPYELRPSDTCKWIISQKMHRKTIINMGKSIIDLVIEFINSDYYFNTILNCYFVPMSQCFKKINWLHDTLVYGYDLDKKILYISDFFKNGKYSNDVISFLDFEKAFVNYDQAETADYLNQIAYLYKFNEKCDYAFSFSNIKNSVKAYLFSETPEYWDKYNSDNRPNITFGMGIYTTLKNYINRIIPQEDENIDIRPFYMLYDHKKMMILRIKFLIEQGYLNNSVECIADLTKIESLALEMVCFVIKIHIKNTVHSYDKIIDLLDKIENLEYKVLKLLFIE